MNAKIQTMINCFSVAILIVVSFVLSSCGPGQLLGLSLTPTSTPMPTPTPTSTPYPSVVLKGHTGFVDALAFSPDGAQLASGSTDNTIRLWDVSSSKEIAMVNNSTEHPNRNEPVQMAVDGIAFSPDGKSLISHVGCCGSGAAQVLSVDPLKEVSFFTRIQSWAGFAASPDAKIAATTACIGDMVLEGTRLHCNVVDIVIMDLSTGNNAKNQVSLFDEQFIIVGSDIGGMAFSPDGSRLAVADVSGILSLINVTDMTRVVLLKSSGKLHGVAFSPDGGLLAVAGGDNVVSIFDIKNGNQVRILDNGEVVISVAFSPDGKRIASGDVKGVVRLWDLETGKQMNEMADHSDVVDTLAFSPNGAWLASGSFDKTIRLWPMSRP
jgi:DNA-binding beta-propeller fold protein YncE